MNVKKLILSCFGLGFLPAAPGTFGSVLPVLIFLAVHYFWPAAVVSVILLSLMVIISSVLCVLFAGEAEKQYDTKDPGWIVIDEFAGQSVPLLAAAIAGGNVLVVAAGAFIFFRLFDILKPWPICKAEKLPGGVGILMDDIAAGILAFVVVFVGQLLVCNISS